MNNNKALVFLAAILVAGLLIPSVVRSCNDVRKYKNRIECAKVTDSAEEFKLCLGENKEKK